MKLPHRRQALHLAAGAIVLPALSRFARAQAYPTRPVRIIVGAAPSGTYDIMARHETPDSAAAPAARCKNLRRESFILNLPLWTIYSTTSSASASNLSGTVSPSAFAVLRFIANSYFGRCLNRQVARLRALEDAINIRS
jgi:hypothetical protein